MGRPWRNGLTDVALGAAGIAAIRDYRGETDPYGNEMQLTQMAVVDELAAAADLVKGKFDQVPVAVVRGYLERPRWTRTGAARAADPRRRAGPVLASVRPKPGRPGCATPPTLPDGSGTGDVDLAVLARALAVAAPGSRFAAARTRCRRHGPLQRGHAVADSATRDGVRHARAWTYTGSAARSPPRGYATGWHAGRLG